MSQNQPKWSSKPHRGSLRLTRAQHIMQVVLLAAAMTLLMSPWSPQRATPLQGKTLQIETFPPLYPAFNPDISDYVVRSNLRARTLFFASAPENTEVSVDGQPFSRRLVKTQVTLTPGQRFSFVVNTDGNMKTYHVRCLPPDFPNWMTERPGAPQAEWYIVAPRQNGQSSGNLTYVIVFDNYGVPLWWYPIGTVIVNASFLPNGNMAWIYTNFFAERQLNGSLVRSFRTTPTGGYIDGHELQLLPNGNYLRIAGKTRGPVDLSPYGGSSTANVGDNYIEEIAPDGSLVWSWSAMDHIPVSETSSSWQKQLLNATPDPYHMNSIEADGDGYVVSLRHLDAIIRIDKATGNIVWKLGGTQTKASLQFVGDPYGNFGGQHDARILDDGTLTLHDNGSRRERDPRAVRYSIDTKARTATFLEQVMDPESGASGCCGSARKLPDGNWVMSWGGRPIVTEITPAGERQFRLNFLSVSLSYRADPLPSGVLSREALRAGMDAQYPR